MKVIVGMSGGVDSSVSAFLLKRQGFDVIGLFMKSWEEEGANGVCKSSIEYEDVVRVCDQIQIPVFSVNLVEEYRRRVFEEFLQDLKDGLTPNPDILCNREIKFDAFLKKAMDLSADYLATGHYCRKDEKGRLLRGVDPEKDQSYFLHAVKEKALTKVLFPVGHLQKKEVREIALREKLATAEKKDSTGICFIGKRDFKPFVSGYLGYSPGDFKTLSGEIVGRHDGAAFYTIGQRKGLGLGGAGDAWFVVDKEIASNTVFVERGEDALFHQELHAEGFSWVLDVPEFPFHCTAKIRYRGKDEPCRVEKNRVIFDQPQRAITPGQFIVFYDGEICLGGARILKAFKTSSALS